MNKAWLYVILTSVCELVWLYGFKAASAWWHWIFIVLFIICDLQFLAKACEGLPTGTVYAIFAGTGTVGTILMDYFFFDAAISSTMLLFMGLILVGVVGLNLSDVNTKLDDADLEV
ncbi:SMR family transporter [Ignatzschineria sp. RMDPL8A]|uniref:DMT family transporter n=1 Tax=Ignatzschineria sp. RMDPL8A TaxID=2999236 RepID=UPI00244675D1|nr:SMR family transporter [Ignatzschineria sp. RMDPL8A]MDG9730392.1 SMR family transporter [Ignatzschineria sp. RMDPL8A]